MRIITVDFSPLVNKFFRLSDNMNYHDFGFTTIFLTDGAAVQNLNYHKLTDVPETLDFEKMAEVVRKLSELAS